MNRETYLEELRSQNGECSCPSLAVLYSKREDLNDLEKECKPLSKGLNLNHPKPEDLPRLRKFREKAEQLHVAENDYNLTIAELIEQGDLNVFCYDPQDRSKRQVSGNDPLQKFNREKILTVECSNCSQQVDILHFD